MTPMLIGVRVKFLLVSKLRRSVVRNFAKKKCLFMISSFHIFLMKDMLKHQKQQKSLW